MSVIKWQPLAELDVLRQQIKRLFDYLEREETDLGLFVTRQSAPWMLAIELEETAQNLVLRARIPGVEPDKLNIQVSENAVFLASEYQESVEPGLVRSEFQHGHCRRVIPLPLTIQREHVQATILDGLLTLTMPKAVVSVPSIVKVSVDTKHPPELSASN
jgi:HSP20 family protein